MVDKLQMMYSSSKEQPIIIPASVTNDFNSTKFCLHSFRVKTIIKTEMLLELHFCQQPPNNSQIPMWPRGNTWTYLKNLSFFEKRQQTTFCLTHCIIRWVNVCNIMMSHFRSFFSFFLLLRNNNERRSAWRRAVSLDFIFIRVF